jgi:hypothetical protein
MVRVTHSSAGATEPTVDMFTPRIGAVASESRGYKSRSKSDTTSPVRTRHPTAVGRDYPTTISLVLYQRCYAPDWDTRAGPRHWEIDYRKIIGIYRNFDGKLLHSNFTTVSEVVFEL